VSTSIFAAAALMLVYGAWAFYRRPELRAIGARTGI
jgi:hypothetical protein